MNLSPIKELIKENSYNDPYISFFSLLKKWTLEKSNAKADQ